MCRVAERLGCSSATVKRWVDRCRAGEPLTDRLLARVTAPTGCLNASSGGSLPEVSPATGARIVCHLRLARSSVGRVLKRYRMPLLAHVDRASGLLVPKPRPVRHEKPALGDLVHVDIKKLGRIRDGGGWRVHGRVFAQGRAASSRRNQAAQARTAWLTRLPPPPPRC